jgi:hypothetical protein
LRRHRSDEDQKSRPGRRRPSPHRAPCSALSNRALATSY